MATIYPYIKQFFLCVLYWYIIGCGHLAMQNKNKVSSGSEYLLYELLKYSVLYLMYQRSGDDDESYK